MMFFFAFSRETIFLNWLAADEWLIRVFVKLVNRFAFSDLRRSSEIRCIFLRGISSGFVSPQRPSHALCDGPQSLKPEQFDALAKKLLRLKEFVKTIEE